MNRRQFVSFEGIEGCGKTTQIGLLSKVLDARGIAHHVTREPGGTAVGEGIRKILLHSETIHLTPAAELLLFFASRSQNILEKIEPALARGEMVICDRFYDASMAYQGYGRGLPLDLIERLTDLVCGHRRPTVTLLLDIEPETGLRRARARNGQRSDVDEGRFEMEDVPFYTRVREGYLEQATKDPDRIRIIDANRGIDDVHDAVLEALEL
jgi:dTMP kinase